MEQFLNKQLFHLEWSVLYVGATSEVVSGEAIASSCPLSVSSTTQFCPKPSCSPALVRGGLQWDRGRFLPRLYDIIFSCQLCLYDMMGTSCSFYCWDREQHRPLPAVHRAAGGEGLGQAQQGRGQTSEYTNEIPQLYTYRTKPSGPYPVTWP